MIGTPRPKPACDFCGDFEEGDPIKIPFDFERCDADGERVRLPSGVRPYAELLYYYKHGYDDEEARPLINAAVSYENDGWAAMFIEIRYCPYCGRDLWEAMNKQESS